MTTISLRLDNSISDGRFNDGAGDFRESSDYVSVVVGAERAGIVSLDAYEPDGEANPSDSEWVDESDAADSENENSENYSEDSEDDIYDSDNGIIYDSDREHHLSIDNFELNDSVSG